jgi:hypothetical protein
MGLLIGRRFPERQNCARNRQDQHHLSLKRLVTLAYSGAFAVLGIAVPVRTYRYNLGKIRVNFREH